MARSRWDRLRSKKQDDEAPAAPANGEDNVHLDDPSNDWWAKRDVETAYTAPQKPKPKDTPAEEPKRDTFTEYFSTDSLFIHNQPHDPDPRHHDAEDIGPFSADDPYVVLSIPSSASWEEITIAHRRLAKLHHPDRLLNAKDEDRRRSEQRMRDINIAYSELRRRRGK